MRLTKPLELRQSVRYSNIIVFCNATPWTLAKMYRIFVKLTAAIVTVGKFC